MSVAYVVHRTGSQRYYGRATLLKLKGQTPLTAIPGVAIDWDKVLAKIL